LRVVWRSQGKQIQQTRERRQVKFVLFLLALLLFVWRLLGQGDATSLKAKGVVFLGEPAD
jgi:hypothetical protein